MKEIMKDIIKEYLKKFPNELERLNTLINYINENKSEDIIDWNNFNGHIVASGFVYDKSEKKFLVLYHNDMKMYLYPGGHISEFDLNPLEAAKREVKEETGLFNLKLLKISDNELVPFDIDTHIISYNERLNLPEHYHFDIRYLFEVENIKNVKIDEEELRDYKWISFEELKNESNFGNVILKLERIIGEDLRKMYLY